MQRAVVPPNSESKKKDLRATITEQPRKKQLKSEKTETKYCEQTSMDPSEKINETRNSKLP